MDGYNAARARASRFAWTQYVADDFRHQLRAWAITPCYPFVAEPQTNGLAERLIRTLKEQALHGRIFGTLDDVREPVRRFVELYNSAWRLEKTGFLTPNEAREAREQHALAQAAQDELVSRQPGPLQHNVHTAST